VVVGDLEANGLKLVRPLDAIHASPEDARLARFRGDELFVRQQVEPGGRLDCGVGQEERLRVKVVVEGRQG
jgi:hypothetical protein